MIRITDDTYSIAHEHDIYIASQLMNVVLEYQLIRHVLHDLIQSGQKRDANKLLDNMDELAQKAQRIICSPFN